MNFRPLSLIAALALVASPALAQQKPLVSMSGQTRQLPPATTLGTQPSTTTTASINIPQGTAPTAPNNGDVWTTSGGIFSRINGATQGPLAPTNTANSWSAAQTFNGVSLNGTGFENSTNPSLTGSVVGGGSTWPYQDTNFRIHSYGTTAAPLVPNIGIGAFITPEFSQTYVGANHKGGVQGRLDLIQMLGAADAATVNRNYVAYQAFASATTSDGGTGTTPATAKGALFGIGTLSVLYPGATNWLNITGAEVNVQASAGSSLSYKSGIQIAAMPDDKVQGSTYDAALSISNQGGAVGWKNGILFSNANGQSAISSAGCFLCVADAPTVTTGISLVGANVTGAAFASNNFTVDGSGNLYSSSLQAPYAGAVAVLGSPSSAGAVAFQMRTSGLTAVYDSSISGFGGSGTTGAGGIQISASLIRPATAAYAALGDTSNYWNSIASRNVQLVANSFANLPVCNSTNAGVMAHITDASVAITAWHQQVTAGGGSNRAFITCNGSTWNAFSY